MMMVMVIFEMIILIKRPCNHDWFRVGYIDRKGMIIDQLIIMMIMINTIMINIMIIMMMIIFLKTLRPQCPPWGRC